jgi:DNA polymerase-3 subunit epsilon
VRRGFGSEPHLLLDPLVARMRRLAADERFEEAASTRDRLNALSRALQRRSALDALRAVARLVVHAPVGLVELHHGRMVLAGGPGAAPAGEPVPLDLPPGRHELDELIIVDRWLAASARRLRVDVASGPYASPMPRVPSFEPVRSAMRGR